MKSGLLWFDDDPDRDLAQKVALATGRYRQKFGDVPDTCYVHQDTPLAKGQRVGDVQVMTLSTVLRHHFWIGREQRSE